MRQAKILFTMNTISNVWKNMKPAANQSYLMCIRHDQKLQFVPRIRLDRIPVNYSALQVIHWPSFPYVRYQRFMKMEQTKENCAKKKQLKLSGLRPLWLPWTYRMVILHSWWRFEKKKRSKLKAESNDESLNLILSERLDGFHIIYYSILYREPGQSQLACS